MSEIPPPREFTTTRWSVVLRAGGASPEEAHAALEQLCSDYWYPLYAFVRRKGHSPEDAADLTLDFFAKLLANDFTQGLTPEGGRFRSFLLTSLNRFLIDEWHRGQCLKRGGGMQPTSLDVLIATHGESEYLALADHHESPERVFQRAWAETLLNRVLTRLGSECSTRGDSRFRLLRPFITGVGDAAKLTSVAEQLGLSLSALKSLLHRFRERYRELLLDEIRQTVGDQGDTRDELRALMEALR